jgi:hypothetical protein
MINKIIYLGNTINDTNTENQGKGKVKFSPLQALEALRVVRG